MSHLVERYQSLSSTERLKLRQEVQRQEITEQEKIGANVLDLARQGEQTQDYLGAEESIAWRSCLTASNSLSYTGYKSNYNVPSTLDCGSSRSQYR